MSSKMKIGILGGGQLARMLIEASYKLPEISISLWCDSDDESTRFYPNRSIGNLNDESFVTWAKHQDFITFEHEHVPVDLLAKRSEIISKLRPNIHSVAISQDREKEKQTFEELEIPVADWTNPAVETGKYQSSSLFPGIVKTATHGYDGKGQASVSSIEEVEAALQRFSHRRCILEKKVNFEAEVSQVSVRTPDGSIYHYPLVQNTHRNGILSVTKAPAAVQNKYATIYAERLANHLNYVGVLAVEFFVSGGKLIANEWAPRVHNSGHWSIEGARTSQFENHLRAVAGLPIGSCDAFGPTVMWNLIGVDHAKAHAVVTEARKIFNPKDLHLNWYEKSARQGRKVGHITVCESTTSPLNIWLSEKIIELQNI